MSNDPEQTEINVHNNAESKAYEQSTTQRISRAGGDGGAPPRDAPPAGQLPEGVIRHADEWNPIAGREISDADRAEAVTTDDNAREVDGPPVGHA